MLLLKSYQKNENIFTIYSQMPINQWFIKIKYFFLMVFLYFLEITNYLLLNKRFVIIKRYGENRRTQ